ncbi:MAG TPA: cobalamin-dependent protein [Polyangiaceae bacterium]|nr:cobalamin-dependent protein [Polyangiaceae bacterium]
MQSPRSLKAASPTDAGAPVGEAVLSIGALSHATGIPVETLRTWERRYGFPAPGERESSGHRRYPLDTVERLRLVSRALDLGHKPSVALRASIPVLRDLLALTETAAPERPAAPRPPAGGSFIDRCLSAVAYLDGPTFVAELERAMSRVPALEFLTDCCGPLLHAIGEAWSRGDIEVGHEHFASEHLREFLSGHWRPLAERAKGARIVCATIGGEHHVLGLHLAAMALAIGGARVVFLGANMPPKEVASAALKPKADAIALSAAAGVSPRALSRDLGALAAALPRGFPIVVGGAGFDPPPPGVLSLPDLAQLSAWASALSPRHGPRG